MTVDYARTPTARANRERKAAALADTCRALGVTAAGIDVGGGRRREVWKAAGLTRAPSEDTWHLTATLLGPEPEPTPARETAPARRRSRSVCVYGCEGPVRQYVRGTFCEAHAPAPAPTPPPGTTAADLREKRGRSGSAPSWTVLDDRAVPPASGARRLRRSGRHEPPRTPVEVGEEVVTVDERCGSCDGPINQQTGECRCSD